MAPVAAASHSSAPLESAVLDPGPSAELERALAVLSSVVSDLDPSRLSGRDATSLYRLVVGIERRCQAGKTLLAPRIEESLVWRDEGHRNASTMLALIEGVSAGHARNTLANGSRLKALPGTEEALRDGALSPSKLTELTTASVLAPEQEASLLEGVANESLAQTRQRCQRSRAAAAKADPVGAMKAIRAARNFSSWIDPEGAFCYQGRDTPERGARILSHIEQTALRLRKEQHSATGSDGGENLPERCVRADAFYALITRTHPDTDENLRPTPSSSLRMPGAEHPTDVAAPGFRPIDTPPRCDLVVRVDLAPLLRGHLLSGECCEIDNVGPIPVAMARDLANDSFLALVFHQAGDIKAVSHFGRTIKAKQRTALFERDRTCVVPGCGVSYGLEIDHVIPFVEGGPTSLENLALLCHHHHFLKTFEGWTLTSQNSTSKGNPIPPWRFEPPPPFGQEPDLGIDRPEQRSIE
jgi:Domain of unknown function (DUF222)/HNH endonuclease